MAEPRGCQTTRDLRIANGVFFGIPTFRPRPFFSCLDWTQSPSMSYVFFKQIASIAAVMNVAATCGTIALP